MIIYKATAAEFLNDCFKRSIGEVVLQSYQRASGRSASASEVNAWALSLQQMASTLHDEDIPKDAGIAVEYTIPQSSKRVDFIISGYGDGKRAGLIIVELKQWSTTALTKKDGIIVARRGGRTTELEGTHPSYQAWSYAALLRGFNEAVYETDMDLRPCAYLHNHPPNGAVDNAFYKDHIAQAPLFLKGESERERLRALIKAHIKYGDAAKLIELVEGGRIRPSKALADSLASMLRGNQDFVLIDDQKVVHESVLAEASSAAPERKKVVVVQGGPGTGKSVVAINLLVQLTKRGLLAKYVSKNAAPRAVYKARLTGTLRQTEISSLFGGSGAFIGTERSLFDVLIVDEAHRLNEKSGLYGNLGEHQVKELIGASKCTVFFIDESQRVTFNDIGSLDVIRHHAERAGASVSLYTLSSQFRCNGSDGYIAWLDEVLGIRETANKTLEGINYDFRVMESPSALHNLILDRNNERNRARVVAGYCWDWVSKRTPSAFDIVLEGGAYKRKWNLDQDGSLWIIADNSVEEIGCIHTCQGLEVDYIGVIIGPDLLVRNGKVITNYLARAAVDRRKSFGGIEALMRSSPRTAAERADEIIKNTYRTLMSRGMRGCYVWSADSETRAYFAGLDI